MSTRPVAPAELDDGAPATEQAERPPAAGFRQFELAVVEGADLGARALSRRDRIVVGSHETADLRLRDPMVSRFHVEVVLDQGRLLVRDLGSRNGTLVDGVAVLAGYVVEGSALLCGNTRLQVRMHDRVNLLGTHAAEGLGDLVGATPGMREVFAALRAAAAAEATVLLLGATGTGKEAAAQAIHDHSARRTQPFLVVDCGALAAELMAAELFGHTRGAFTGADAQRIGIFEAAAGGTVFLDEIGELPLELQPRLLRVLERREVKRVGENHYRPVDVRIVAATNRDLRSEVSQHRFRSDLYYRLAVLEIRLLSLGERLDDLPLLTRVLLERAGRGRLELERALAPELQRDLRRRPWPGNVRQLRNFLERWVTMGAPPPEPESGAAMPAVGALGLAAQPFKVARQRALDAFERAYVADLLRRHDDNVSVAATAAGLNRSYLYRLLWRAGLR